MTKIGTFSPKNIAHMLNVSGNPCGTLLQPRLVMVAVAALASKRFEVSCHHHFILM